MHEDATTSVNETAVSSNLMGGRFAPRWLYFEFYLACRNQKEGPGAKWISDPTFTAWNVLGASIAMPWAVLLLLVDHYLPFLHPLGQLWIAWHLPGNPEHAWGYAWMVCGIVTLAGFLVFLFGGRYEKIMQEFSPYDRSRHTGIFGLITTPIWLIMFAITSFGAYRGDTVSLLCSNLLIWSIFIATEIGFRIWWRGWCRRDAARRSE